MRGRHFLVICVSFLTLIWLFSYFPSSNNEQQKSPAFEQESMNLVLDTPSDLPPFDSTSSVPYYAGYQVIRNLQSTPGSMFIDTDILGAQAHLNRSAPDVRRIEYLQQGMSTAEATARAAKLTTDDIVIVVMGSSKNSERLRMLRDTWLGWVDHFYIFGDKEDQELGMITIPELQGKTTYDDAQHRQLKGLIWLKENKPAELKRRWILLVDDDTWLNIPGLLEYLGKFDEELPMVLGWFHLLRKTAILSGGAGMMFSRSSIDILVPKLYTSECSFSKANDVTLSQCAFNLHIVKTKCMRLWWSNSEVGGPKIKTNENGKGKFIYPSKENAQLGYHWIKERDQYMRLTCIAGFQFKSPVKGLNCGPVWRKLNLIVNENYGGSIATYNKNETKLSTTVSIFKEPSTTISKNSHPTKLKTTLATIITPSTSNTLITSTTTTITSITSTITATTKTSIKSTTTTTTTITKTSITSTTTTTKTIMTRTDTESTTYPSLTKPLQSSLKPVPIPSPLNRDAFEKNAKIEIDPLEIDENSKDRDADSVDSG